MILGVLAMIAANGAVALGARLLLARIAVGRPAVDVVLFLLLRLLLISAAVLIAGSAGGLTAPVLGIAGAAALALLFALGAHRGLRRPSLEGWDRWVIVLAALVAVRLLLQVWFLAPFHDDTLSYHLPKIAEWIRSGGFTRELGSDPRTPFPAGFELIETWWVVFLHHDALIEMAGVEFLVLAGAGAFALAREMGWSVKSASIAALFFVLTPGLHLQATSCLNDGPVAALVVASAALILARVPPALILVPVGLGIGIKPTTAYALPGLAVIAWLCRREPRTAVPSPRAVWAVCGAALAVGAAWYLRNWVIFGNPVHPMGLDGMKTATGGTTLQRMGPSVRSLVENLSGLLDVRIYDRINPPNAAGTGNFNWGAAAFAIGAPALVLLLRTEAPLRRLSIGLALSMASVFFLVQYDLWSARFVLFLTVLPALALARLWERHRIVAVLASAALGSQLLGTCVPGLVPGESLRRMVFAPAALRAAHPVPQRLDRGGTVGYFDDADGRAYLLYGPDFSRRVVYLRDETLEGLLSRLRTEGLATFYCRSARIRESAMVKEGVRRGVLRPFQDGEWPGYEVVSAN
jgi:hypothetical protein